MLLQNPKRKLIYYSILTFSMLLQNPKRKLISRQRKCRDIYLLYEGEALDALSTLTRILWIPLLILIGGAPSDCNRGMGNGKSLSTRKTKGYELRENEET